MFTDAINVKTVDITEHDKYDTVRVILTEDGTITGGVTATTDSHDGMTLFLQQVEDTTPQTYDLTGTDQDTGAHVEINTGYLSTNTPDQHDTDDIETGFRAGTVTTTTAPDDEVIIDSPVTVKFEMLNFDPPAAYIPLSNDTPLLERDSFEIHVDELPDTDERIDTIKEWQRPLRTGTIRITQHSVNGPPDQHVSHATGTLEPVVWLLGFLQGVLPAPVKATIETVDGTEPDWEFEKWFSSWRADIGSAFSGRNISQANDPYIFLDHGYDQFVERADDYKYRRCLSWYFDALLQTRTVDAKTASITAGIESLARRYAAYDEDVGSDTDAVIANIVDELDVPVDDLAAFSSGFEESDEGSNAYFYVGTRNAVIHNDRVNVPFDDLFTDYEAALTLFRRIIFHEFTPKGDRDRYTGLNDLEPRDNRFK